MLLSNFRIRTRLAAGFGAMALLVLLIGGAAGLTIRSFTETLHEIDQTNTQATVMLANAQNAVWQLRYGISQYIAVPDPASRAAIVNDTAKWQAQIDEAVRRFGAMNHQQEERAALEAFTGHYKAYTQARPRWLQLYGEGKLEEAAEWRSKTIMQSGTAMVRALEALVEVNRKDAAENQARALAAASRAQSVLLVSLGVALAFAAGAGTLISRSITAPLDEAMNATRRIASGDLTMAAVAHRGDELGQLMEGLKQMNDSLALVVGRVRAGSDTIAAATNQIASGNQDLAQRGEEQAASLEQTAASMEELTQTVKQNADSARTANQLASSAADVAAKGGAAVGEVVSTMDSINGSSKKIMEITSVIDGIAFQTNILALNAAVEAARAGEQGRGFAVVAAEVRNLAQRSAEAAKEIKALIDDSVEKAGAGSAIVARAGATMQEIVTSVQRVNELIAQIAAASLEQSHGIGQVNQAVSEMDRVTQENARLLEQANAAAHAMQQQGSELVESVSVFKLPADEMATRLLSRVSAGTKPPPAAQARTAAEWV